MNTFVYGQERMTILHKLMLRYSFKLALECVLCCNGAKEHQKLKQIQKLQGHLDFEFKTLFSSCRKTVYDGQGDSNNNSITGYSNRIAEDYLMSYLKNFFFYIGGAKYLPKIFKCPFESLQQSISKQEDLFKKKICVIYLTFVGLFCFVLLQHSTRFMRRA